MFDIGFAELLIIGVVALLVIGPERLPEAARTASAWLNRIRRGFNDIKQEVQQELHNDAVMRDLRDTGSSLKRETEAFRENLTQGLSPPELRESGESKTAGDPGAGNSTDTAPDPAGKTASRHAEGSNLRPDQSADRD